MASLFDVEVNTINYHLKEVYKSGEIQEEATIRKFRIVQTEGKRQVNRKVDFYNLDAIISVGYRVNSVRATQFRQWAIQTFREFAIKGCILDRNFSYLQRINSLNGVIFPNFLTQNFLFRGNLP